MTELNRLTEEAIASGDHEKILAAIDEVEEAAAFCRRYTAGADDGGWGVLVKRLEGAMNRKISVKTYRGESDLQGWDPNLVGGDDYYTTRAGELYEALGASYSDEEYVLARRQDEDRWALFGLTIEGWHYAVEVWDLSDPVCPYCERGYDERHGCGCGLAVCGHCGESYAESTGCDCRWLAESR